MQHMRKWTEPQYAAKLPDRRQLEVFGVVQAFYHIPAPAAGSKDDFPRRRIQKSTESNIPPRNDAETTVLDTVNVAITSCKSASSECTETVRGAQLREFRTRAFTA
ncbi:hypothetical protein [Roseibium album]|uniref:hypothetical protein n=1 Tax=Roseibium album TaxID=311410 RepID=UPI00249110EA|nr:hypothetical protein [Roseibium album]